MYNIRWDRVLVFASIILLPVIYRWLTNNLYIGSFYQFPILGAACSNPELKALILFGLLLLSLILIIKTLKE
ncbi:MAG: hypothetical protein DRP35_04825 [Candidatus Zixiibacteriota bacterium]|nr:MAG: hypothetical protein DRP35_04825 [candidate division Zixibacteria bacterium]